MRSSQHILPPIPTVRGRNPIAALHFEISMFWKKGIALNVTLDPDTAQSWLILSEDRKSVMQGATQQHRPDNPERFDPWPCVLGCEGFDSGRPCWEVEVGCGSCWAVGVALESVRRKGPIDVNPVGGIWAVGRYKEKFQALTSPTPTPFLPSMIPRRVRVCVNHAEGRVTFVNADNEAAIFTFLQATFSGKRIYPWLWFWKRQVGSLQLLQLERTCVHL
uniref:B30.2/SPRY domain-containing protein n=1 Tax=Anser brachyrhynchus TaxID=132585 RepID=A0A8B9BM14_9AVES